MGFLRIIIQACTVKELYTRLLHQAQQCPLNRYSRTEGQGNGPLVSICVLIILANLVQDKHDCARRHVRVVSKNVPANHRFHINESATSEAPKMFIYSVTASPVISRWYLSFCVDFLLRQCCIRCDAQSLVSQHGTSCFSLTRLLTWTCSGRRLHPFCVMSTIAFPPGCTAHSRSL